MAENMLAATDTDFEQKIRSNKLVLVDFWAPWCGPCRRLNPVLEELAKEMNDQVQFVKVNTDENPMTPSRFGVMSIPTMILFKNGEPVDQLIGAHPKENIVGVLRRHA